MSLTSQPIAQRLVSPPHAMSASEVLAGLLTDRTLGLSAAEAQRRLQVDGPNQLAEAPPTPAWKRLAAQFQSLVIWILIFAAIIAGALGEWVDTLAILAIVALNGLIGFLQEQKAERALVALKKLSAPVARVFRDGQFVDYVPHSTHVPTTPSSLDWYRGWREHLEFAILESAQSAP